MEDRKAETTVLVELKPEDELCILRVRGRIGAGADEEYLTKKLDEIRRLPGRNLLVDFQQVASVGSSAISFLASLYTLATKTRGGRFVLVGAIPRVRAALDITRMSNVIPMADDEASGFAAPKS